MRRLGARICISVLLGCVALLPAAEDDAIRPMLERYEPGWYDADAETWVRADSAVDRTPERVERVMREDWSGGGLPSLLSVLLWGLLIVALAALTFVIIRYLSNRAQLPQASTASANVRRRADRIAHLPLPEDVRHADPRAALAEAQRRGDGYGIVLYSYAVALLDLDQAGAIRLRRGETNRGYLRQLHRSAAQTAMGALVEAFERVYFGRYPVDPQTSSRVQGAFARVHAVLGEQHASTAGEG